MRYSRNGKRFESAGDDSDEIHGGLRDKIGMRIATLGFEYVIIVWGGGWSEMVLRRAFEMSTSTSMQPRPKLEGKFSLLQRTNHNATEWLYAPQYQLSGPLEIFILFNLLSVEFV